MAQHADVAGQPGFHIDELLKGFSLHLGPLLSAALTEDPALIKRALDLHGASYATWVGHLSTWAQRVETRTEDIKVAKQIWDICMLVMAAHEAAVSAAAIARGAGRPPMPPLPALAGAGGGAAISLSAGAYLELSEALRKLIASGAMDAVVVVGLSRMLQMNAAKGAPKINWGQQEKHLRAITASKRVAVR